MDLWIISQDKQRLIKVDNLYLSKNNDKKICYSDEVFENELGTYTTKERALEVLDEIQNVIRSKYATSFNYEKALSGFGEEDKKYMLKQMAVYEMPKE